MLYAGGFGDEERVLVNVVLGRRGAGAREAVPAGSRLVLIFVNKATY
jgi:hypothetical protein